MPPGRMRGLSRRPLCHPPLSCPKSKGRYLNPLNPCRPPPWPFSSFSQSRLIACSPTASKNKFVHLALQKTLSLALEARGPAELEQALGAGIDITIVGDNDFYSQQDQARIALTLRYRRRFVVLTIVRRAAQEPTATHLACFARRNTALQPHGGRARRRSQDRSRLFCGAHLVLGRRTARPVRLDRTRPARERLRTASRAQRRAVCTLPRPGKSRIRL